MMAHNAGDHARRDEEVEKAISAIRDVNGEEAASEVRDAFLGVFSSLG